MCPALLGTENTHRLLTHGKSGEDCQQRKKPVVGKVRTVPTQGDFLEEVALQLGPEGWTGFHQVDTEGKGQLERQKELPR